MATIQEIYTVAEQVVKAYKKMNALAAKELPKEIENIVLRHAKIACATAFIPAGGLDILAATTNVWVMYISINNVLGIKFSKNVVKSVGSAVISNAVHNLGILAVAEALKWNPLSYAASVAILCSALYALTIVSGWVYLKALANMGSRDGDIDAAVRETLSQHADIKHIFDTYNK